VARIELRGLSKRFGEVEVLRDVTLEVGDGEIAALLGPSGCGKSTTLFILAGLYRPTSGGVLFDGQDVAGVAPRDRNVGLVFQSYALYPHMSVRENIGFPLVLQGAARAEIARRVGEVAELAGLGELLDRKPSQLSGGQQQRVAAARAMVKRPRLLLMDEPLSNLDQDLRARMRREIKRVQRETRVTTIIVTHDQEEAMSLADRIFVMQSGRIQQAGDHRELYERPANRFVAGFIGVPAMNFFDQLALDGEAGWLSSQGTRLCCIDPDAPLAGALDRAILGVRPEHVAVTAGEGDRGGVAARVTDLVPEGREVIVGLEIGAIEVRSIVPSTMDLAIGDPVTVAIDRHYLHFFAGDDGRALHHGRHRP
jgi:inositol-phosphate transport system ATP-binding protein